MHTFAFIALLTALAAPPTRAPSAEEQRLYDEGLRALQAGDARAAEKAWKNGYAVARDPAFLIYIGEAQEKAGAPAEAADSYRRYLREVPDAADRPDIEQRLARLAPAGTPPPQQGRGRTGRRAGRRANRRAGAGTEARVFPGRAPRRHGTADRQAADRRFRLEPLQPDRDDLVRARRCCCWAPRPSTQRPRHRTATT